MELKKNRKEVLKSLLSLGLCGALFVGSTLAFFTKTVSSNENIIKTPLLDVKFEYLTDSQWKVVEENRVFDDTKIAPGEAIEKKIKVTNEGELPFEYQLNLFQQSRPMQSDFYKEILVRIQKDNENDFVYEGTLENTLIEENPEIAGQTLLNKGENHEYTITIQMSTDKPLDADSYANQATGIFDIQLRATQIEAIGAGSGSTLGTTDDEYKYQTITVKDEAGTTIVVNDIINKYPEAKIENTKDEGDCLVHTIRIPKQNATTSLNYEDTEHYDYIIVKVPKNINNGELDEIIKRDHDDEVSNPDYTDEDPNAMLNYIDKLVDGHCYYGKGKPYVAFKTNVTINHSNGDYILIEYLKADGSTLTSRKTGSFLSGNWYGDFLNEKEGGVVTGGNTNIKYGSSDIPQGAYSYTLTSGGTDAKGIRVTVKYNGKTQSVSKMWN